MELQAMVPWTFWSCPSMVTLVSPDPAAAVPFPAVVVGLSDFSSDEQPDRPAMTNRRAAYGDQEPTLHPVLLRVVVIRQDRRIIPSSMVCAYGADMRLGEKFACALTHGWLRSSEPAPRNAAIDSLHDLPNGMFAGMQTLRTPDEHFADLPEFPYSPRYCEIDDSEGGQLRVAWVEDGPVDADPILMLHGEPSWSFLYRRMIPILAAAGHRVICPDLVGFGRSDKPTRIEDHTYARHVEWMRAPDRAPCRV
jgi:hypothetical protein